MTVVALVDFNWELAPGADVPVKSPYRRFQTLIFLFHSRGHHFLRVIAFSSFFVHLRRFLSTLNT
jgi:hypothetical protein